METLDWRFERKYRIENTTESAIVNELLSNPVNFNTAYANRYVNSIYYDTANFKAYNENIEGLSDRVKHRIRWYGNLNGFQKGKLELKIKKNLLGRKQIYTLGVGNKKLAELHQQEILRNKGLLPAVLIRYKRAYFESQNKLIRATVDTQIQYFQVSPFSISPISKKDKAIILEIKYAANHDDYIDDCISNIPFRLTKNSKYVNAINAFH